MIIPHPAALVVAHPGHELRLFRWLELDHPTVFVLTDGSGRSGRSRIHSSLEILARTGSTAGGIMGRFTDAEIYRAFLEGDVSTVADATSVLAAMLASAGIRSVVADAFELYNPTHDLCSVVAALACERAGQATGKPIQRYAYAVTASPANGISIDLDDTAMQRKLTTAHQFEELAVDVDELLVRIGIDSLRREALQPMRDGYTLPDPATVPFYEERGREQVAAGRYSTVLRYRAHFLPFVEKLADRVRNAGSTSAGLPETSLMR